eukprot:3940299-Rhodomonas_salina.3
MVPEAQRGRTLCACPGLPRALIASESHSWPAQQCEHPQTTQCGGNKCLTVRRQQKSDNEGETLPGLVCPLDDGSGLLGSRGGGLTPLRPRSPAGL